MLRNTRSEKSITTKRLIERILAQPTAPFREHFVRRELIEILTQFQIPFFQDRAGNLIAGVKNMKSLKRDFHIAMFAHTDHPGFHLGRKLKGRTWSANWYGGTSKDLLGAPVRIYHAERSTQSFSAKVTKLVDTEFYKDGFEFQIRFDSDVDLSLVETLPEGSFGTFDFPGYQFKKDILHSRAADDLVGCAMSIGALIDQELKLQSALDSRPESQAETRPEKSASKSKNTSKRSIDRNAKLTRRLIGVFTRAEEVGFVGCVDLLLNPKFPKQMHVISLEASRTLPEAEIGKGPVLRIGDHLTLCHSGFSYELWKVARGLEALPKSKFKYQRRLMSGGMCELTALAAYGHIATALAVPLGNYHNWPGPAPEYVSLRDVDGARTLLSALGDKMNKPVDWQGQTKKDVTSYHRKLKQHLKFDPA